MDWFWEDGEADSLAISYNKARAGPTWPAIPTPAPPPHTLIIYLKNHAFRVARPSTSSGRTGGVFYPFVVSLPNHVLR